MELICFALSGSFETGKAFNRTNISIEKCRYLLVCTLHLQLRRFVMLLLTLKNDGHTLGSIQKQVEQMFINAVYFYREKRI